MEKGKDRISKLFFSDKKRAAEIVTLALRRMGIEERVSEITIEDPVVSVLDTKISIERLLDRLYKVTLSDNNRDTFCLVGLENQSKYDAHMLIRAGLASLLIYDWKLSLKEELKPVYIVVLNMGDEKWKGPTKLEDYFSKEDLAFFAPLAVSVRMIVIDPYTMDEKELEGLETDLELILKVIKYKSDKKAFSSYINSEKRFSCLEAVTAKFVSELVNVKIGEGEKIMCKAIKDLLKDSRTEGRNEGLFEGEANAIYKLRRDGILNIEIAAERLGLSVEKYKQGEDRYFSNIGE